MKRVVLCPNPYRDRGLSAAKEADAILRSVGLETVFCLPFKPEGGDGQFGVQCRPLQQELHNCDLVVAFGGDGTILHLAKACALRGVPLLGVNLGSLGFMSDLEVGEMDLLRNLAQGKYKKERRMMLDVSVLREGRSVYNNRSPPGRSSWGPSPGTAWWWPRPQAPRPTPFPPVDPLWSPRPRTLLSAPSAPIRFSRDPLSSPPPVR